MTRAGRLLLLTIVASIFVLGLPVWTYTAALLLAAILRHRGQLTTPLT